MYGKMIVHGIAGMTFSGYLLSDLIFYHEKVDKVGLVLFAITFSLSLAMIEHGISSILKFYEKQGPREWSPRWKLWSLVTYLRSRR